MNSSGRTHTTTMPAEIVARLVVDLARADSMWARLDDLVISPEPPSSQAARDKAEKHRALAYDHAATYVHAAIDHVTAWRALLHSGHVPTYAPFSVLRTAHESALIAYWLADPGITSDAASRGADG
jgi:hypothetical protein